VRIAPLLVAAAFAAGCHHSPPPPPPVLEPPVVQLSELGALGMIDLVATGADGSLASQEFLASLQAAQPGVAVLELGSRERVLAAVGGAGIDPETIRAIGEKYHVDAILVGEVRTQVIRPRVSMHELSSFSAAAEMEGALSARIFETERGATVWTTSAEMRAPLARVEMAPWSAPDFATHEPEQVQVSIVRELIERATADFQPRWVYP